jgi:hypothetical protein
MIITYDFGYPIRIWTGAPTYSLTNMIGTYDFGYPNSNMDRCKEKIKKKKLSYLDIQIQKWTAIAE